LQAETNVSAPRAVRINTCLHCNTMMTEAVSLRLPEELAERLEKLSRSIDRSKTYIVTKALSEYLEEYEDYLIALHRLNDKDDKIVSEKEIKA
jgi:RHH-type transcriptional regulator, rel operon repressor / antitoxin RelB